METQTPSRKIGAIILAAGQGKRMNSTDRNKVTMPLSGKPIILHIVQFMKRIGIEDVVVVVGFAKETVEKALEGEMVYYAEQKEQLGTGHAVEVALSALPMDVTDVFVVYGDDGVFYNERQRHVMEELFKKHMNSHAACTFLTIEQDDPKGLGRIVRDSNDHLQAIVEEKDATDEQKQITEINPGCFVFRVDFLKKYLPLVEKSPVTGEYYLTSLIDVGFEHDESIDTLKGGHLLWRGVNTPDELAEAEKLFSQT